MPLPNISLLISPAVLNFNNSAAVFMKTTEPPKDDGGAAVTKYVVELSEGLSGESQMPEGKKFSVFFIGKRFEIYLLLRCVLKKK